MPSASKYSENELISPIVSPLSLRGSIFRVAVPRDLFERRIYCFLDTKTTAAGQVWIDAEITGRLNNSVVLTIPATVADYNSLNVNKSRACLLNAGGSPVGDSVVLTVGQQLDAATAKVTLQPFRINCEIDELTFDILAVNDPTVQLTGFHAYLGCMSSAF